MTTIVIIDSKGSADKFLQEPTLDKRKMKIYCVHCSVVDYLKTKNLKCRDVSSFITINENKKILNKSYKDFEKICLDLDLVVGSKICGILNIPKINIFKSIYFGRRKTELYAKYVIELFIRKEIETNNSIQEIILFSNQNIEDQLIIKFTKYAVSEYTKKNNIKFSNFHTNKDKLDIPLTMRTDKVTIKSIFNNGSLNKYISIWYNRGKNLNNYRFDKIKYLFEKYFFTSKITHKKKQYALLLNPSVNSQIERIFDHYKIKTVKLFFANEKLFKLSVNPIIKNISKIKTLTQDKKLDSNNYVLKLILDDFNNNIVNYLDLLVYYDQVCNEYDIKSIAWDVPTINQAEFNLIVEYALMKNIPVIGKQHGGNYFFQNLSSIHFNSDFDRCDYYLTYATNYSIFRKTYSRKKRCKFINIGNILSNQLNSSIKKKIDIVFPLTNCVPLSESERMPQSIISEIQYKIIDEFEKRKDVTTLIKPMKNFNHYDFSHTEYIKTLKKTKIVSSNFNIFLNNYSCNLIVIEFISTPLFDCINYDVDLFILLDKFQKISNYALKLLKKRAFCFDSIENLQKAIRGYNPRTITKLRDRSFSKAYVDNGSINNFFKLNIDL